ncbi:hypothetical protein MUP77_11990 [Candidatus Bathyarchaeota archaeon]|nr:hypothetical protein [Candidatus Bathyarchaeota archaeon]
MLEEEMGKAVLEIIDLKLSPISEKLEKTDSNVKDLVVWRADLDRKFVDMEKKFVVTARLIESVMDVIEKTSSAKKCEADIRGIQLLKGELKEP